MNTQPRTRTEDEIEAANLAAEDRALAERACTSGASLLDHLQNQGYEPQETSDSYPGEWFDLIISGTGTIRVAIYPNDGHCADVNLFDKHMVCEWDVKHSPGTPDAVILATLEAAEWQLAARRGGPVTPAQTRSA